MFFIVVVLLVPPVVNAAEVADGTYSVDYVIKKAEDESASMANDYWEKPAKVIVENGKMTVQVVINHSKWVTEFKTPDGSGGYSAAKVISSNKDEDSRISQFSVADLTSTMLSKIHVTVPEIDYNHDYTIRFDFDEKSMKLISKPKTPEVKEEQPVATVQPTVAPKATAAPKATQTPAAGAKQDTAAAAATDKPAKESNVSSVLEAGKTTAKPAVTAEITAKPEASAQAIAPAQASPEVTVESEVQAEAEVSTAPADEPAAETAETTQQVESDSEDGEVQLASAPLIGESQPLKERSSGWITSSVLSVIIILAGVSFILIRNRKLKRK